jgi:hypothetical protein
VAETDLFGIPRTGWLASGTRAGHEVKSAISLLETTNERAESEPLLQATFVDYRRVENARSQIGIRLKEIAEQDCVG